MTDKNIKGMTITELLVSTILVGIVMMGIVSVDFAVRRMQKSISNDTFVNMRTSATLMDMAKNAAAMTGDQNNLGFDNSVSNRFCFREDINASGALNYTPADYSDDHWICYQLSGTSTDIHRCNLSAPGDCPGSSFILGTAVTGGLSMSYVRDNAVTAQNSSIDISITNRFNPSLAASPHDNPEVTMTTKVYPSLHSF